MPAPRLTPEQSAAVQKKVVDAAAGGVAGATWLVTTLRRIEPRNALVFALVMLMGLGMAVMSSGLLFSGELFAFFMTGFIAVVLVGLALFLLRQQAAALDVLDQAIASREPRMLGGEHRIELVAYEGKDGFTYGAGPYGALIIRDDTLVYGATYRTRGDLTGEALKLFGMAGHVAAEIRDARQGGEAAPAGGWVFRFPRKSILRIVPPGAGARLIITTDSGTERFGVVYDSWVPLIQALARHGYPLAKE